MPSVIELHRDATCTACGYTLSAGTKARYYSSEKIYHEPSCDTPNIQGSSPSSNPSGGGAQPNRVQVVEELMIVRDRLKSLIDAIIARS